MMAEDNEKTTVRTDEIRKVISRQVLEAMTRLPNATAHQTAVALCEELAIYVTRAYPLAQWERKGEMFGTLVIDLVRAASQDHLEDCKPNSK